MYYDIIDDVLQDFEADQLEHYFLGSNQFKGWTFTPFVSRFVDKNERLDDFYFSHIIYMQPTRSSTHLVKSPAMDHITHLLDCLNFKALIRARANLYTNVGRIVEHDPHTDFNWSHRTGLYFVNTNNGYTTLADGTKVKSIKNRLLLFDGSKDHFSSTCTDRQARVTLNFSFF